jgi:hypothetical protein
MANPLLLEYLGVPITETDGPPTHFVIVVVGAATGGVAAGVSVVTGAVVRGATGTPASASTAGAGSQQAGFSGTAASATAGASTFFSQPTRANAATNTIELIANLIFLFLLIVQVTNCFGHTSYLLCLRLDVYRFVPL